MYGLVPGHLAMRSGAGSELKHHDSNKPTVLSSPTPFQPNSIPSYSGCQWAGMAGGSKASGGEGAGCSGHSKDTKGSCFFEP